MFRKCLKYDMRAVWRFWRIMAVCAAGLGLVGSLAVRGIVENVIHFRESFYANIQNILNFFLETIAIAAFFGIVAFFIITVILVYVRFYKNFFSDEGYLTFTLPVKRETLYASKVVNALIWEGASLLIILFDILLAMLIIPSPCSADFNGIAVGPLDLTLFARLGAWLSSIWTENGVWLLTFAVEGFLIVVAYILLSVGLIQLCITLGAIIAKKHKFLAAIGVFYGIRTVLTFCTSAIIVPAALATPGAVWLVSNMTSALRLPTVALLLLIVAIVLTAVACILHFIALDRLERRLNLT